MSQACGNCGSVLWHSSRSWVNNGELASRCSDCEKGLSVHGGASVCFTPTRDGCEYNPNIADANGDPIPLTSRAHKAAVMKKMGIREAGDRVHGARSFDPIAHRHAEESLRSADRRNRHGR